MSENLILGNHVICEAFECNSDYLNDEERIRRILHEAAKIAHTDLRDIMLEKFTPYGITAVAIVSESHLSIHTWPELGYAAIDVFTCGTRSDPVAAAEYIAEQFDSTFVTRNEIKRGVILHRNPMRKGSLFNIVDPEEVEAEVKEEMKEELKERIREEADS